METGRGWQAEVSSTAWSRVGKVGVVIELLWDVRGNLGEDSSGCDFRRVTQALGCWIDEEQRPGGI